jgi:hypothetical protein
MFPARGVEVDRIALHGERVGEGCVVGVVLLVERARDPRRNGPRAVERLDHGADEAVDAAEAREARLSTIGGTAEEGARLEEEPGERARLEAVGL